MNNISFFTGRKFLLLKLSRIFVSYSFFVFIKKQHFYKYIAYTSFLKDFLNEYVFFSCDILEKL